MGALSLIAFVPRRKSGAGSGSLLPSRDASSLCDRALDRGVTAASATGDFAALSSYEVIQRVAIRFGPDAHPRGQRDGARDPGMEQGCAAASWWLPREGGRGAST